MNILFYIGFILIIGLIFGKIVSYIKLPAVTGYLVGGVLIGPSLLGLIPHDAVSQMGIVSECALGFIAYSIGSEFNFSHLKKVGWGIGVISLLEALMATFLVTLATRFIFMKPLSFSLVLGAIAAATAPAATLMVIKQYKAKGPLVDTLIPVVAIDDAISIMTFGVAIAVAKVLVDSSASVSMATMFLSPIMEIVTSLGVGVIIGLALSYVSKKSTSEDNLLCLAVATVLIGVGIATKLEVSSLLLCMAIGGTIANVAPNSTRVLKVVDKITPPIFMAFFVIAGAELNLSVLGSVGLVGIGYIVFRVLGKYLGAGFGARIAKSPKSVQKYLGLTLVPQAGVAIGLSMIAESILPNGQEIRAIILSATVVYELIGPLLTKIALYKAGEILGSHAKNVNVQVKKA